MPNDWIFAMDKRRKSKRESRTRSRSQEPFNREPSTFSVAQMVKKSLENCYGCNGGPITRSLHLRRSRQGDHAPVLGFLDMVPYKVVLQPGRLPFGQRSILAGQLMTNGEPLSALGANHHTHNYCAGGCFFDCVAQPPGGSICGGRVHQRGSLG